MATLNAHGSFYRIQDNMTRIQRDLGDSMERLSSGLKNISAGMEVFVAKISIR